MFGTNARKLKLLIHALCDNGNKMIRTKTIQKKVKEIESKILSVKEKTLELWGTIQKNAANQVCENETDLFVRSKLKELERCLVNDVMMDIRDASMRFVEINSIIKTIKKSNRKD